MTLFSVTDDRERASRNLFVASFVIYTIISMTKGAYAASIASIIGEGIFNKSYAGMINAGFYLFYGAGQLFGVSIVDKASPIKLVYISLLGTFIALVGMSLSHSFISMLVLWSFCGLIQFAIWPAILRIISEYLLPKHKKDAMTVISFSYCAGTLSNYLIAAVVLKVADWEMLFAVSALVIMLCTVLWAYVIKRTKPFLESNINIIDAPDITTDKGYVVGFTKVLFASGIVLLLIPAVIRTMLDAGLKSWVPTMIVENYDISVSFASMLTTILVLINLGGIFIANYIYPKRIKNASLAFGLCFAVSLPFTFMLLQIGKINVVLILIMLTILTTMMYAGHQFINVIIPASFAKYNKAGSVASILNAVASFGAMAANIGFGFLAENYGWNITIWSWVSLTFLAMVLSLIASPLWSKFNNIHK